MMRSLIAAAAFAAFSAGPASAITATLDFENFAHGDVLGPPDSGDPGSIAVGTSSATVKISAFQTNSSAVFQPLVFDTSLSGTADPDLEEPFNGSQGSGTCLSPAAAGCGFGKVAIIQEQGVGLGTPDDRFQNLPGTMLFEFDTPISLISLAALDFEASGSLQVFLDGVQITPDGSSTGISGNNRFATFAPTNPTVFGTELEIVFRSSGAIDNIEVNVIPLPAGAWLLLSGFGFVAGVRQWRKRAA